MSQSKTTIRHLQLRRWLAGAELDRLDALGREDATIAALLFALYWGDEIAFLLRLLDAARAELEEHRRREAMGMTK